MIYIKYLNNSVKQIYTKIYFPSVFTSALIILFFNAKVNVNQFKDLLVFLLFAIFLYFNTIETDYMQIDLSDVLIYCLFLTLGARIIYIFLAIYPVISIMISKIKYNKFKLKSNLLNFADDTIMVFAADNIAKIYSPVFTQNLQFIKIQLFMVFVAGTIVFNIALFYLAYYAMYGVKIKLSFNKDMILQIFSTLVCAILACLYLQIYETMPPFMAYIYLMVICIGIFIFSIMHNVMNENNQMSILHGMSNLLIQNVDLANKLQNILEGLEQIMPYRFAAVYVFQKSANLNYPVAYKGDNIKSINDIRLNLSEKVMDIIMEGKTFFLDEKDKKRCFFTIRKNENVFVIPLQEFNSVIGCIIIVTPIKIYDNRFKKNFIEILAGYVALAVQNEDKFNQLKKIANTDFMTSLLNYRSFKSYLSRFMELKTQFCMATFDIDDFKRVNDTFGHLAGNEVLKEVAKIITETIRFTDTAFRYGGEEFCVLFDGIVSTEATAICESIRRKIEECEFDYNGERFRITISCGITEGGVQDEICADSLFELSDRALYLSKQNGKNRTTLVLKKDMT